MLAPGAYVDRYELVCPIGEGGMAQVWVARQRGKHGFEKLFALKSIHPRYADDPAFRAMFLDEARIAAAIQHPNVAQVFDLGEDGSQLYLVMELVDGESLSSLMAAAAKREGKKTTTVPIGVALRVVADVCAGLQAAHRLTDKAGKLRGVVHRDVSPHNVLLGLRGDVKLIDFGIAHAADRTSGDTGAGSLKGKINYMAPEQALKRPVGPSTDVFGAGAMLYRMLAGRTPFDGGSEAGTLANLMSNVAPAPLPDSVPPLVAAIVERAIARDPGDRYASAQEMVNAIEGAIVEEGLVPDVATWVGRNLSERARARRAELDASSVFPEKIEALPPAADIGAPPRISQPPENTKTPGFMDVRALVAQGPRPIPRDDAKALPVDAGGVSNRGKDLDDDGAPVVRPSFAPAPIGVGKTKKKRRPLTVALAIGGVAVLALGGVLAIAAPRIARSRAIAEARAAGIDLDVGVAAVGFGGVTLNDVTAKIPSVPALESVRIDRIEIVGFSGDEVRISNLDATIDGPLAEVGDKLVAFAEQNRRRVAGTTAAPRKYVLVSGRFTWKNAFGEGTVVQAGEANGELDSRGAGVEEVRAAIARFDITTSKSLIGPWALSWERNAQSARARVMFDPALMDGPSALVVWGAADSRTLTVRIPRSPLANLGLRARELALPADTATELEAKIDATRDGSGKIEGKGKIDVWAARLAGWNGPVDIHLQGGASGVAGKPLGLDKGTELTVGPFVMALAGTLEPRSDGLRLDTTWRTQPIACASLVHSEAAKMGPIVEAIQDLANKTGAARVTGTANAAGVLRWDSHAPGDLAVTFTTKETCGLSLFGL